MRFDIKVVEDRIRKFEEVRRMLSDPEIVQLLSEALMADNDTLTARLEPQEDRTAGTDEADRVIREVMQSTGSEGAAKPDAYWARAK